MRFACWLLIIGAILTAMFAAQIGLHNFIAKYGGRGGVQTNLALVSSGYFEQGPYLAIPAALILLIAFSRRRTWPTGLLLGLAIAITLLVTVRSGGRIILIQLLLPLVVLWYLQRDRRPRALSLVLALIIFIQAANILSAFRGVDNTQQGSVTSAVVDAASNPGHGVRTFLSGADASEFSVLEIAVHSLSTGQLPLPAWLDLGWGCRWLDSASVRSQEAADASAIPRVDPVSVDLRGRELRSVGLRWRICRLWLANTDRPLRARRNRPAERLGVLPQGSAQRGDATRVRGVLAVDSHRVPE